MTKNSKVRGRADLSSRGFEEFRRDLRYWTVPAVHLIVELLHFAIGELAGEFGERGFEAGDGAQAIGAGGDADFVGRKGVPVVGQDLRSEEHTSELQSHVNLVCRLLLEKKKK